MRIDATRPRQPPSNAQPIPQPRQPAGRLPPGLTTEPDRVPSHHATSHPTSQHREEGPVGRRSTSPRRTGPCRPPTAADRTSAWRMRDRLRARPARRPRRFCRPSRGSHSHPRAGPGLDEAPSRTEGPECVSTSRGARRGCAEGLAPGDPRRRVIEQHERATRSAGAPRGSRERER